jgi:hypothetical protein
MADQLLLSDNTDDDDDQAQGDGSSSSSNLSDNENSHRLTSFLSNEDIDKCLYVTNINWRRRFSVSFVLKELK